MLATLVSRVGLVLQYREDQPTSPIIYYNPGSLVTSLDSLSNSSSSSGQVSDLGQVSKLSNHNLSLQLCLDFTIVQREIENHSFLDPQMPTAISH